MHLPDEIPAQPSDDYPASDDRHSPNRARLIKLIRVAMKQAQSEGEFDAVNDLLGILKTLNAASAPMLVASMAAIRHGLG
jgi:hypothetical protein